MYNIIMNNKFIFVLFLTFIIFFIYSSNKEVKEHFCPDKLTIENHKFILHIIYFEFGKIAQY